MNLSSSEFIEMTKRLGFINVTVDHMQIFIRTSDIAAVWRDNSNDIGGSVINIRGSNDFFYPIESVREVFERMQDAIA